MPSYVMGILHHFMVNNFIIRNISPNNLFIQPIFLKVKADVDPVLGFCHCGSELSYPLVG